MSPVHKPKLLGRFHSVLVVEDHAVMRRSLVRAASRWGAHVRAAANLDQARTELAEPVELLIADVRLPDGSSHALFERAMQLRPAPLLIAISGSASATETFELGRLGVRGFLEKPFASPELERCIAEAVAQRELDEAIARARVGFGYAGASRALERFARHHGLTDRQTHILRLALSGVSRMELPGALGISENTCKSAVRRLLARCEAERLSEVVQRLLSQRDLTLRRSARRR